MREKTIAWHTPFAACKRTPYTSAEAPSGEAVFVLRGKPCGFGVIKLGRDPEHPDCWNATGYRSTADYEKDSDDKLVCSVDKLNR